MTLIDASFWTKIVIRLIILFIVVFVGGYYAYVLITTVNTPPSQIFRADYKCGAVPDPVIYGLKDVDLTNTTISVEAEKSALPVVPIIAYVYKVDVRGETFSSKPRALELARQLGFDAETLTIPAPTLYRWRDEKNGRTLNVDIATLNFDYTLDKKSIPSVPNTDLPSLNTSVDVANEFLGGLGLYSQEFKEGKTFTYPVTLSRNNDTDTVTEVRSLQQASLVRVDYQKATVALKYDKRIENIGYNRSNVDFLSYMDTTKDPIPDDYVKRFTAPRVSTTPVTGNVQVYVNATRKTDTVKFTVFKTTLHNWKTEELPCGTYPIISPSDALRAIKEGHGKLVYLSEKNTDRLNISSLQKLRELNIFTVQLAYYEPFDRPEFLQPIYVAEGDATFEGGKIGTFGIYIPAIQK